MSIILLFCLSLIVLGCVAFLLGKRDKKHSATPTPAEPPHPADGSCCGMHATCERDSLLSAMSRKIEYYDDEELDRYKGRPSDGYNSSETDEFREVLYTMREDEVPGWVRSLQLREVELPQAVREEVILIVGDLRNRSLQTKKNNTL